MYDVCIIGGGPAGVSAAVVSAEMGAKTVLIEKEGWLGGMPVGAYVIALCGFYDGHLGKNKIIRGNFETIIQVAIDMGFAEGTKWNRRCKPEDAREITIDPEGFKRVLDTVVVENNIDLYLRSFCYWGIEIPQGIISDINIVGKYGVKTVQAKTFVDCTGDADTAEWLGLTYTMPLTETESITMGIRLGGIDTSKIKYDDKNPAPRIKLSEGDESEADYFPAYGWMDIKCKDNLYYDSLAIRGKYRLIAEDITNAEILGRKYAQKAVKVLRELPGYENTYVISTGPVMGNRKPRHVITQYYLSDEDENQNPYDSIAIAGNVMKDYGAMKIPLRALLPKKIKNLIYAGRCITPMYHRPYKYPEETERRNFTAFEIPRLIPCCMATGEAAGVAAALCADKDMGFDKLEYTEVQKQLERRGAIF